MYLPTLSEDEEAMFAGHDNERTTPVLVQASKFSQPSNYASPPSTESTSNRRAALSIEEQRAVDEKQGRVQRDRTTRRHASDGGWWGNPSPFLGTPDGGPARVAVTRDQLRDPAEEDRLAAEAAVRRRIAEASALIRAALPGNRALARSLIQLGWTDAVSFSDLGERKYGPRTGAALRAWTARKWPAMFGANGSIRFPGESGLPCNAGVLPGLALVEGVRAAVPGASWADVIQLACAEAVEALGGPHLDLLYGRVDVEDPARCAPPAQFLDRDKMTRPAEEVERVLAVRLGLGEEAALALCAPGLLGWDFANPALSGPGRSGPLVEYAAAPRFAKQLRAWSESPAAFLAAYAAAHRRLSELGSRFVPERGVPATERPRARTSLIVGWAGPAEDGDAGAAAAAAAAATRQAESAIPWRSEPISAIFDEVAMSDRLRRDAFAAQAVEEAELSREA